MRNPSQILPWRAGLPLALGALATFLWLSASQPASACDASAGTPCATATADPDAIAATREVARRAAVRRNRQEQRAIRELLVQSTGLCQGRPEQHCPRTNRLGCAEQLRQTCAVIASRAAQCEAQARQFCAQRRGGSDCVKQITRQCPSTKRQDIDELLARYQDLTPVQKARVRQLARQLEANKDQSLAGTLINSLLELLGFG